MITANILLIVGMCGGVVGIVILLLARLIAGGWWDCMVMRRKRLVVMLLTGGAVSVILVLLQFNNTVLIQFKSDRQLVLDTESGDENRVDRAVGVLTNRLNRDKLSQSDINTLITRGLDAQADSDTVWLPAWGNFLETAIEKNDLSRVQAEQYIKNAFGYRLYIENPRSYLIPTRVQNKLLEYSEARTIFHIIPKRCGDDHFYPNRNESPGFYISSSSRFIDDQRSQAESSPVALPIRDDGGVFSWERFAMPAKGKHTATLQFTVHVTGRSGGDREVYKTSVITKFETVAKYESTLKLIKDPSLEASIRKAIHFDSLTMMLGIPKNPYLLTGMISIVDPPCPLAFDIFMRDGKGKEWRITDIALNPPTQPGEFVGSWLFISLPGFSGSTGDVILRSSAEVARNSPGIIEFWDGEIVIKEVSIERQDIGHDSK